MSETGFCVRCGSRLVVTTAEADRRPECPGCGWIHATEALPVVLVLAHTEDGRVLYTRRASWPAGAWALVAGFIEPAETAEAAAIREVYEEAGLRARAPRLLRTMTRDTLLLVCVDVELDGGEPRAGSDVDEVLLVPADPALIPAEWQARALVDAYVGGRVSG